LIMSDQLDRIRALLRKAEGEGVSAEEAEAFTAKAYELCEKYEIDKLIAMQAGDVPIESVVNRIIDLSRPFKQKESLAVAVYMSQGCHLVKLSEKRLHVFGFESSMRQASMLFASLQAQGERFWTADDHPYKKTRYLQYRRAWWHSYAMTIHDRLEAMRQRVASGAGTALVLYDKAKAELVNQYPNLRQGRKTQGPGDRAGYENGSAAGRRADFGDSKVGAGRRELGA
jgi:hypothetical protein